MKSESTTRSGKKGVHKYLKSIAVGLAVLICVPVLFNLMFGNLSIFDSFHAFINAVGYGFAIGLVFWVGNVVAGTLVGRKLDWQKNPNQANLVSLLVFIGYGVSISLLIPWLFAKYFWNLSGPNLANTVVYQAFIALSIDLVIISIFHSRYLVYYWGKTIKNEEALKRENLISKYEALKNQVNPHFLFNTLNTLTGVVEHNPAMATEFIRKLSDIYRYVLEIKDKELVDLNQELKFVNDFVYLSRIRHGEGLQLINNMAGAGFKVVPLGLQILIENAIKHNIISDDRPLTIEMGSKDEYIYVRNNLQRKSAMKTRNPIGLENLVKKV